MDDLATLTLTEAHKKLVAGEVSSTDLTKACLDRITARDKDVLAHITVTADRALAEAKVFDDTVLAKKQTFSLLGGIPFSLKDVFCTEGVRTTASSKILENFIPPYTATSVQKLYDAGAILVAKDNCDQFGYGSSTENSGFQTTRNPINLDYVPGGSSGGSSASVADDHAFFALGGDTGGSIRQPASLCGIVGLKVTYGRVSRYGVIACAPSLDTIGPFAKSCEDAAAILGTIAGTDPFDATSPPHNVDDYVAALQNTDLKGLRIGIVTECFGEGIEGDVKTAVEGAITQFSSQGCTTREISLPHSKYALAVYYPLMTSEASSVLGRYDGIRYGYSSPNATSLIDTYSKSRSEAFGAETKRRIMLGTYCLSSGYEDKYYDKATRVRTLIRQDFEKAFEQVDILITPTSPIAGFKIGEKADDPLAMYLSDIYTVTPSLAGVPAINVPCGISKDGMPIGMQIIGPMWSEGLLLRVGHVFEQMMKNN